MSVCVNVQTFSLEAMLVLVLLILDQLLIVTILVLVNFFLFISEVLSSSSPTRSLLNFFLTMSNQKVILNRGHLRLVPWFKLDTLSCRHWTKNSLAIWFSQSTDQTNWVKLVFHIHLVFHWRGEGVLICLFAS